eukprot:TRINITY_DN12236_c0_g1_i1.p1 TRINITY_DN12236_c0_g1~~TRINITY_DN12236_c0_g1_i1.p1  ORF type:complete len:481 (-),score=67.05 TRINITY_DN12236_c0_g1_i1:140-1543(-)
MSRYSRKDQLQATFRERMGLGVRSRRGHYLATNDYTHHVLGSIDGNHMSSVFTKEVLATPLANDQDIIKSGHQSLVCVPMKNSAGVHSDRVDYGTFLKSPCFDKTGKVSHICTFLYNLSPISPGSSAPIPFPLLYSAATLLCDSLAGLLLDTQLIKSARNNSQMLQSIFLNQMKDPLDSIPTYDLNRVFFKSPSSTTSQRDSASTDYEGPTFPPTPSGTLTPSSPYSSPFDSSSSLEMDAEMELDDPNLMFSLEPVEAERAFGNLFTDLNYDTTRHQTDLDFAFGDDIPSREFGPPFSSAPLPSVVSPSQPFFYCGSSLLVLMEPFLKSSCTYSVLIAPDAELHLYGHRLLFLQAIYHLFNGVSACKPTLVKVLVANGENSMLRIQVSFQPTEGTTHLGTKFLSAAHSLVTLLGGNLQFAVVKSSGGHLYTVLLPQAQGMAYSTFIMTLLSQQPPNQSGFITPIIPL